MARKLKTTLFTRFIIMLIIVAPLAYIGASYYNGQDPIANIKGFFSRFSPGDKAENRDRQDVKSENDTVQLLKEQLKECQEKNEELNRELGVLKSQLNKD